MPNGRQRLTLLPRRANDEDRPSFRRISCSMRHSKRKRTKAHH